MLSEDRRKAIAAFLRIRRARLQPADVGIPAGRRRRTPGLRREEVALLAGVSTEWYTWLEQAREVRASQEVLRRIAHALRLEPGESRHLLTLAGYGLRSNENGRHRLPLVGDHLQRLMDQLEYCPAWVCGERWDILGWNRAATVIHGDLAAMEGIERNTIYQLFLNPRVRRTLVDWEQHASGVVGKLRVVHARYVDDPWYNELIEVLCARSPEFAIRWADHEVQGYQYGVKRYEHPEAGRLSFDYTVLSVVDERCTTVNLITYLPSPETGTREKMMRLLGSTAPRSARGDEPLRGASAAEMALVTAG